LKQDVKIYAVNLRGKKMFCNKCKCQFVEGIERCPDCGKKLVENKFLNEDEEQTPEYVELVTIAITNNYFIVPLVKSILDSAEIYYFIKGEELLNMPRFLMSMEVQVAKRDVDIAKELLKDLDL
jgi:hypothetical protein